ncbi:type VI secretion system membrane subunit TssM [Trinickia terrae]|uniref:type VI secretion system membrane subunit TssM n=1 Tax=Trinickia terrae TaxID=2571161 RepID=UPI001F0FD559|nr:type VI secretion system membrane subunit TssM [Trinickia terrae]
MSLLVSRRVIAVLAAIALALAIWYLLPSLSIERVKPFAPASTRIAAMAIMLAVFVAHGAGRLRRDARSDRPIAARRHDVAVNVAEKNETPLAAPQHEKAKVEAVIADVLRQIGRRARGIRRLFQHSRRLYEIPWYIVLGSRASGKTSAVLNAGLAIPLAEQRLQLLAAHGEGANSLQCWLADDAVLVDTPGDYVSRDGSESGARATAEWRGLLDVLRKTRPLAPINGALLTVDMAVLLDDGEEARKTEAAALRVRLDELRKALRVDFPVYLLVTKIDQLPGFEAYFGGLPPETRARMWGFALGFAGKQTSAKESLQTHCAAQLGLLAARLADEADARLYEESDTLTRRKLIALSTEFAALAPRLEKLIADVFADSRDGTHADTALRGVYFTSAAQTGCEVAAERQTIVRCFADRHGLHAAAPELLHATRKGYFLRDLFKQVIFPDASLVLPDVRVERRRRVLNAGAHVSVALLFAGMAAGLWISFDHNRAYLDATERKARLLAARVEETYKKPDANAIPAILTDAQALPAYPGLDLAAPAISYRFGLYTPGGLAPESRRVYAALEDKLLLPQIVRRQETVIAQAIAQHDAKTAYDALRVYLMLHDKSKFNAADVKAWVLDDESANDDAAESGARAAMAGHIQALFSGARIVQSPLARNDALIRQARAFLDGGNATQRLYARAKAAMLKEAPGDFTLLGAVGPHAGEVFTRASGAPLSSGVPGLFTYDGYHNLFDKRLPEFVQLARDDDTWVMGHAPPAGKQSAKARADDPLTNAIRMQYLNEYAQAWQAFLADIRPASGSNLAFGLSGLRDLVAPDSPLVRLSRAAVHETTLTQPASALAQGGGKAATRSPLDTNHKARMERDLVDSRFTALREVVTDSADAPSAKRAAAALPAKTGLDGLAKLLNDYSLALTIAQNALASNTMPPPDGAAARLKMTATAMPAPFSAVLLDLAAQGSHEINRGIGRLLSQQMAAAVGDSCRQMVDGNYPFAPESSRDIGSADFTRLFAQGGILDDFFTKKLAPLADTSARPWRYKTLPGAAEPVPGPDLEPFQHAKAIRDAFFDEAGQKLQTWKGEIRVPELDPNATSLLIDIDGQTMLYEHGPVEPLAVSWPGPRGGVHALVAANPEIRPNASTIEANGPWALMRLVHKGRVIPAAAPGRTRVVFDFEGRPAVLDIASTGGASAASALANDLLTSFRCPGSMPAFGTFSTFSVDDTGPPPGLPPGLPPLPEAGGSR